MESGLHQILFFLGGSILLVPLFHKLGLGNILAYLVVGMIIGPFGLEFINDQEKTMHLAELGVVLLLFVIGLEIQPTKLWSMRRKILGLGFTQVLISSAVFSGACILTGMDLKVSLVVGFGLSLSSTAFAIQNLNAKNELQTEFGQGAFSVLLTQDLIAIPALAVIPTLVQKSAQEASSGPDGLIYFPVIIILLVILSRYLMRPLFRVIASLKSREIFTATSLFIVMGVAVIMLQIGLSAALGTFIAGVLLADSEYRHELEANVDPFKSLLMGLFFIAVGMGVSISVILSKPLLVIGLSILYFFTKWFIIYALGRLNRLSHENSKQMGLAIAQGGEFAFVIFGIAAAGGVLPKDTFIILSSIVTISMMMSPLIDMVIDKLLDNKNKEKIHPEYDTIEGESPKVIIGGFGRFGQIFGRILRAQGIPFVAIDHDAEQVELIRKFGNKVYYGDIARLDILHAAGASQAKYLILAIDDVEKSVATAQILRKNFPQLKVFARARNRGHAFDLLEEGISHVKRETLDSSANFVGDLLVEMGFDKERAALVIEKFKEHDESMLLEQLKIRSDDKMYVSVSLQGQEQLNQVLNDESQKSYVNFTAH